MIKAVIFDAYGTLCEIQDMRKPYKSLVQAAADPEKARRIVMTRDIEFRSMASMLGCSLSIHELDKLELDLQAELASVKLFPDVRQTLYALKEKGCKLAIASNLATPYAIPIKALLPNEFDVYGWSFEIGSIKPEAGIFLNVCAQLGVNPSEAIMVGDSYQSDLIGALNAGCKGILLNRIGKGYSEQVTAYIRALADLLHQL